MNKGERKEGIREKKGEGENEIWGVKEKGIKKGGVLRKERARNLEEARSCTIMGEY